MAEGRWQAVTSHRGGVAPAMSNHHELEIIGTQPRIEGGVCEEIIAVQYWYAGRLEEPVNSVHFKVEGQWHRFCIDCGVMFWRIGEGPPVAFEVPENQWEYPLDDIGRRYGLRGLRLATVTPEPTPHGARLIMTLHGGRAVEFVDHDDQTDYVCSQDDQGHHLPDL